MRILTWDKKNNAIGIWVQYLVHTKIIKEWSIYFKLGQLYLLKSHSNSFEFDITAVMCTSTSRCTHMCGWGAKSVTILRIGTGKSLSEAHNMLRKSCVRRLFWMSKQKQKSACVHNMFWACNFMYWTCNLTFRTLNLLSTCCELLTKIYLYYCTGAGAEKCACGCSRNPRNLQFW